MRALLRACIALACAAPLFLGGQASAMASPMTAGSSASVTTAAATVVKTVSEPKEASADHGVSLFPDGIKQTVALTNSAIATVAPKISTMATAATATPICLHFHKRKYHDFGSSIEHVMMYWKICWYFNRPEDIWARPTTVVYTINKDGTHESCFWLFDDYGGAYFQTYIWQPATGRNYHTARRHVTCKTDTTNSMVRQLNSAPKYYYPHDYHVYWKTNITEHWKITRDEDGNVGGRIKVL